MSDLFLGKFRTQSMRLKGYDYSNPGVYFVTILTDGAISFFGRIDQDKIQLSPVGKIIFKNWINLSKRFERITLDDFIIMPDHLHGIIILNQASKDAIYRISKEGDMDQFQSTIRNQLINPSKNKKGGITKNYNPMISMNTLSYYIRWFKGRSSFEIRKFFPKSQFKWHPGYYDKILRNKQSFYAAKKYIRDNPINWRKKSFGML